MSNKIMKTLTINGVTYEVYDKRVDSKADQSAVEGLNERLTNIEENGSGITAEEVQAMIDSAIAGADETYASLTATEYGDE